MTHGSQHKPSICGSAWHALLKCRRRAGLSVCVHARVLRKGMRLGGGRCAHRLWYMEPEIIRFCGLRSLHSRRRGETCQQLWWRAQHAQPH